MRVPTSDVEVPLARAVSAYEAALYNLREQILSGALRAGDRVDQRRAAEQCGCSIVPVREALKTLEGEGRLVYRSRRGYLVAAIDLGQLREVYRMRELLEEEAIRQGLPKIADVDTERLRELMLSVTSAGRQRSIQVMIEANRAFHFALFAVSGSDRLCSVIELLWTWTDGFRSLYYTEQSHRERVEREHSEIFEAVVARDVDGAVKALAAHRRNTVMSLERAFRKGNTHGLGVGRGDPSVTGQVHAVSPGGARHAELDRPGPGAVESPFAQARGVRIRRRQ